MNEQVACLVGWRREAYLFDGDGMWQHPNRKGGFTEPRYTADDLLAWLLRAADTQDGVEFAGYWSTEPIGEDEILPPRTFSVHIGISDENGDMFTRESSGPTLLAALEAAVVAASETEVTS